MHVKRLLIGSILYLNIALCLGHKIELENDAGDTLEVEVVDFEQKPEYNINEEIIIEEEEIGQTAIVDKQEKVNIYEDILIDKKVSEVDEKVILEKEPKIDKTVNEKTVVVKKEPKIDHKVVSNGGSEKGFTGKEIVEKEKEVPKREIFLNDGIVVRKSRMDWGPEIFKIYGDDKGKEIEEVTELEDEDRFGDGTLAQLLDEFLLDPLDSILELLKQTLRSVVANLDHILEQVFKVVAALLNVVLVLVLDILILVVHILADLIPGVFGKSFNKYDDYVTECVEKVKMDPITTSLIELEQCITDPLFHIIENVIIILTDVQQLLGELDQGLRQLDVVRKAEEALTDVVAIVLDVVERVLETVENLVEGPIADILVIIPVLLACILGDIGKNLLGGLLNLLKKYVACTTYADFFDFNTVVKSFTFWE